MTVIDDTLAVIRADARILEAVAARGHLTGMASAPDALLVSEIAYGRHLAEAVPGGVEAMITDDYDHDQAAFCQRMRDALWCSARLHGAQALWPVLTATDVIYLYAVRVELGWAVLDVDTWRRVVAQPELVGDDLDDCGGGTAGVVLTLQGRGPVTYRRAERVWGRSPAVHAAALDAADRLAEGLLGETAGEGSDV